MKKIIINSIVIFCLILSSCTKKCNNKSEKCTDSPPVNEVCNASFTKWFYNPDENICKEISYSGCTSKGFVTKADCEECDCN